MSNDQPKTVPCSNPALKGWTFLSMSIPSAPLMHFLGKTIVEEKPVQQKGSSNPRIPYSLSNANKSLPDTLKRKRTTGDLPDASSPKRSKNTFSETASIRAPVKSQPSLSEEQRKIHDYIIDERKNVFFTGSAGTGKSVLLRHIINSLRKIYGTKEVVVTASTGIAAVNIDGVTLHSFAKLGSGDHTVTESVERILMSDVAERLWLRARVLIIDEISMIDGSLLDKVEKIARNVRQKQARFGGIQVIMSGDFFQLPPVNRETDAKLAFEAKCWNTVVDKCFILKHCFRQKDSKLVEILNQIRVGYVSEEAEEIFKSLSRTPKANHGIIPTELYPLAHEVCRANRNRLSAINSDAFIFKAVDKGNKGYLDTIRAPLTLELKVGAQVMLIKNLSPVLVNGSLGVVTKFTEEKDSRTYPVVKFTNGIERVMYPELWSISVNGKVLAYRQQVPLILAWALSIHKSQGQTIEYVKVDLANIFERGHAYVALSRSVTMDNLQILNFDKEKIRVNEKAAEFYKRIES